MALLTLGPLAFDDFEIPGKLRFGGAQQLAVHRLIGGARVIDAMGRDDAALRWSGVFSGTDAGDRARLLDAMRAAGQPLSLSWDAFCYSVVIEHLDMDFCNPWWIPYQIACTVVMDLAQNVPPYVPDLADSIAGDLTAASAFVDVSPAIAATSAADALTSGNADYEAASVALARAGGSIAANIQAVQSGLIATASQETLMSGDLTDLVSSSGSLAMLCVAQGYVARSAANLANVGS